ncbi:GAP family protein [Mycolicibacterium litorale]|uniref:Sap-like sulfolipid-1-addressing protein n=1 Tax=Mycolicibacterium litorale TaxID=758802 RepID=A0AAD1MWC1_9MYCO|nr:GAP family protein [Mycolicibacterium litorale]MCV7417111.1 GAP family protein [Mycolicibacterium litorale]TDY04899.1 Sap-like sulfolipid-1-addressing protein [Mycolicibacterium litorale]BBY18327.1 hypothetical protein MLIT_39190 [Mycolicibacterium litorale]
MWIPLLLMAVAASLEPVRVGMTVLMISRPHPARQLLAFLAGGCAMATAAGLVALFLLRPALGSAEFTLPMVQIAVGAVVLVNAALVVTGVWGRGRDAAHLAETRFGPLAARTRRVFTGPSLWTAGVAGLGVALPSVDYLAALALIVASGAAIGIQLGALLLFNVIAFALVEIPLLCYLVAPDRTRAALAALYEWLRAQGRRGVGVLLAVIGCALLGVGFAGL